MLRTYASFQYITYYISTLYLQNFQVLQTPEGIVIYASYPIIVEVSATKISYIKTKLLQKCW